MRKSSTGHSMAAVALLACAACAHTSESSRPMEGTTASPAREASALDSRTIPHPEWVQVSGQIEETRTVAPGGQQEQLLAVLRPVEGGRVIVDLGPVRSLGSIHLQDNDYLHVRGTPSESGRHRMIIAHEIIADGKVVSVQRPPDAVPPVTSQSRAEGQESPAAPAAQADR
jgi:hypothetical protein